MELQETSQVAILVLIVLLERLKKSIVEKEHEKKEKEYILEILSKYIRY